jgi:hypothetical protein
VEEAYPDACSGGDAPEVVDEPLPNKAGPEDELARLEAAYRDISEQRMRRLAVQAPSSVPEFRADAPS